MRERILKEAIKLFLHQGFQGTSIKDITDAVNLTKAAMYWHFRSKNELLETILEEWERLFLDGLIDAVDAVEGDFLAKFKRYQFYSARFASDHGYLCVGFDTLAAEIVGSGVQVEEKINKIQTRYHAFITKLIEEGKKDGWIDPEPEAWLQAHVIIGMHKGILIEWFMKQGKVDGRQLGQAFRKVVLSGLVRNEKLPPANRNVGAPGKHAAVETVKEAEGGNRARGRVAPASAAKADGKKKETS